MTASQDKAVAVCQGESISIMSLSRFRDCIYKLNFSYIKLDGQV